MRQKSSRSSMSRPAAHIEAFGRRLSAANAAKKGTILLRLKGAGGGDYRLGPEGAARVTAESAPSDHILEVIADASRIKSILEGKRNARAEYFAGGIRVRGDVQHAIDLAYELGFIKEKF